MFEQIHSSPLALGFFSYKTEIRMLMGCLTLSCTKMEMRFKKKKKTMTEFCQVQSNN